MGREDTDGEWGELTHFDYGFRIYNLAIGKFLSVDPLMKKYPWYTPYQFAGNKPIFSIDLDGLEDVGYLWILQGEIGSPKLAFPKDYNTSPIEAQLLIFQSYSRAAGNNKQYQYRYSNYSLDVNVKDAGGSAAQLKLGFTNYLPKRFLDHYALGNGNDYILNETEMKDVRAIPVGIQGKKSVELQRFSRILSKLKVGGNAMIDYSVVGGALNSGTF